MNDPFPATPSLSAPGWLPKLGVLLLVLALVSPLLAPVVLAMDVPEEARAPLAGLMLFGLPMALIVVVVALTGQPAHAFLRRVFAGPRAAAAPVGAGRYRFGLVLLALAVLVSWLEPVVSPRVAEVAARRVVIGAGADALVLLSLFILGGEFWEKVHALFVHDARVRPDPSRAGVIAASPVRVGWRFYAGIAILLCSFSAWGLVPIASSAGWSTAQVASLSGAVFIGTKVGLLTAIAVMGKDGFNYTKSLVFGFLKQFGPPAQVSQGRYRLGLLLFLIPFFMTWLAPYATGLVRPVGVYSFLQGMALEALLLVGLFLLGGEFWDKVRALFSARTQVDVPRHARG